MYSSSTTLTVLLSANSWTVANPPLPGLMLYLTLKSQPCMWAPLTGTPPPLSFEQISVLKQLQTAPQPTTDHICPFCICVHVSFCICVHVLFCICVHISYFVFNPTFPILYLCPRFIFAFASIFPTCVYIYALIWYPTFENVQTHNCPCTNNCILLDEKGIKDEPPTILSKRSITMLESVHHFSFIPTRLRL